MTLVLPGMLHGGWVLLTTVLIMRASYSITKQRRNDRIVGTAVGCVVAAHPGAYPAARLAVPADDRHRGHGARLRHGRFPRHRAVAPRSRRCCSCISWRPETGAVFFERIVDTLIGAGARLGVQLPAAELGMAQHRRSSSARRSRRTATMPRWHWRAAATTRSIAWRANAPTTPPPISPSTVRRLADEPQIDRRALVALNELLRRQLSVGVRPRFDARAVPHCAASELEPAATERLAGNRAHQRGACRSARTRRRTRRRCVCRGAAWARTWAGTTR